MERKLELKKYFLGGTTIPISYGAPMELRHLRYFVAVAEELSVTRAAQKLHISQPALSRQIRDLERELKVDIFVRSPNSIALTEEGKIFLNDCIQILRRTEKAVEKLRLKSKKPVIKIGFAATPAAEILKQSMQSFQKKFPDTQIELQDLTSNGILRGIRENKLDLGITVGISPQSFEGLTYDDLGSYAVNVAFHKKHRFANLRVVPLAEIGKEDLITFTRSEHPEAHTALRKIFSPVTDDINIVMECDGISSLFTAVESGKGVALGFETMAKIAGKRLFVRPITPAPPRLPVVVTYKKEKLSDEARYFLSILNSVKSKSIRPTKRLLFV